MAYEPRILPEGKVGHPSMSKRAIFSPARAAALLVLAYCILFWYLTEQATEWGDVIHQWRQEYYGENGVPAGSMKFRTPEGRLFVTISLPWGLLVYPISFIGAIWYSHRAFAAQSWSQRIIYSLGIIFLLAILARFVWLGVFSSVIASL